MNGNGAQSDHSLNGNCRPASGACMAKIREGICTGECPKTGETIIVAGTSKQDLEKILLRSHPIA